MPWSVWSLCSSFCDYSLEHQGFKQNKSILWEIIKGSLGKRSLDCRYVLQKSYAFLGPFYFRLSIKQEIFEIDIMQNLTRMCFSISIVLFFALIKHFESLARIYFYWNIQLQLKLLEICLLWKVMWFYVSCHKLQELSQTNTPHQLCLFYFLVWIIL